MNDMGGGADKSDSQIGAANDWQEMNAQFLSNALAWLRARLERLAAHEGGAAPATEAANEAQAPHPTGQPHEAARPLWKKWTRAGAAQPPGNGASARAAPRPVWMDAETSADLAARQPGQDAQFAPPALLMLAERLGLDHFELDIVLLCAAQEFDTGMPDLCGRAQGRTPQAGGASAHSNPNTPNYPTFALAMQLFKHANWNARCAEQALRYWRLIDINQHPTQSLTVSALRADERIVNYIKGINHLDDRLTPLLARFDPPVALGVLPTSQQTLVAAILRQLQQAGGGQLPLVQLLGAEHASKELVARGIAEALGLQVYRLPCNQIPSQSAELEALARLWQRESLLLPLALFIDAEECGAEACHSLSRLIDRLGGLVLLDSRESWQGVKRASISVDVAKPSRAEQQAAWNQALLAAQDGAPGDSAERRQRLTQAARTAARLSGQFNLDFASLRKIAAQVGGDGGDGGAAARSLWQDCLAVTRPRMDALTQRLEPKAVWADLVLPELESKLLRQIAAQVDCRGQVYENWGFHAKMNRGMGISALFAGESGTGKTMAAEVIANALQLNLYRIDLSAVVSKYIGETEKNLRRLFDAAEDGGAILLFDEADALFGKRSEVKDSHDRYANIEVNYLLQRMECYGGLAILATNMKSALDPAFLRRLRFVVNFPFPGAAERKAIWQRAFPPQTPCVDLDFERLARLNVTGGQIHNIALNAAFIAADQDAALGMAIVLDAARTEFRKMERPINEADFRWMVPGLAQTQGSGK